MFSMTPKSEQHLDREAQAQPWALGGIGSCRLQGFQQGDVALEQGLEVPVLLQGARLAGMHIGEVRVKHQGQVAGGQGPTSQCGNFRCSF